jgi:hypothetical protein
VTLPQRIDHPVWLLVEGETDKHFFYRLIDRLGYRDIIWVMDYGGKSRFRKTLEMLKDRPEIVDGSLEILAVVRDADNSHSSAFQSVRDALRDYGFAYPKTPMSLSDGKDQPITSVFIVPDVVPGAIENLFLAAHHAESEMTCVQQIVPDLLQCLSGQNVALSPANHAKAAFQIFLAAKGGELHAKDAFKRSWFNWDSEEFAPIYDFLTLLADAAP